MRLTETTHCELYFQLGGAIKKRLVNQTSEPQSNFADFSRFPSIPSQEVLVDPDSQNASAVTYSTNEKHRRSWSLDYNNTVSCAITCV